MTLRLLRSIEIPALRPTGFDHGDVILRTGHVFVAHSAAGTVEVLDGEHGQRVATVRGCPEASGVLCVQEGEMVFAAARGAGKLLVIEAASRSVVGEYQVGKRPNGLAWNGRRGHLLVADVEDNSARLIEPSSGVLLAEIELPGRPRWCAYDEPRDRFLVNIRDPACVVSIDAESRTVVGQIPVSTDGPHGLDLDKQHGRAFVACDGGKVIVLDLATDYEIASVPIAGVPDAIWFNSRRSSLYVAIGDPGVVEVIDTSAMAVTQQLVTEKGAHTTAYDDQRQLLYVFLPLGSRAAVYADE